MFTRTSFLSKGQSTVEYLLLFVVMSAITISILGSDKFKQISQTYSENRQEALKYINNKLSKYFLSDNYNISSFLGHYILYDSRNSFPLKADAIMYPSIQAGLNNFNLAIHPDFVKNNLQLIQVQKVKFKHFEENASKLILLKTGIPNKQNKFFPKSNIIFILKSQSI